MQGRTFTAARALTAAAIAGAAIAACGPASAPKRSAGIASIVDPCKVITMQQASTILRAKALPPIPRKHYLTGPNPGQACVYWDGHHRRIQVTLGDLRTRLAIRIWNQRIRPLLHPLPGTPNVLSVAAAKPGGYDVILLPGHRTLAIGQYFWTMPDSSRHYMAKLMQALYNRFG